MEEKTLSTLVVRAIRVEDLEGWRPLWDGYNAFYERVGPTALSESVTRVLWERFFDDREPIHALIAEAEGELVGLAHYLFHRNTSRVQVVCYLQDLFTAENARRRGVGRALIEQVYEEARRAGAARVYWHTHTSNVVGRALYDQMAQNQGFIVYSHDL